MGKRLSEKNPFLRDPVKKRKMMVAAIQSSQRQEGIETSDARAQEVYKIVFEEPRLAFFRLSQADEKREETFVASLNGGVGVRFDSVRRDLLAVDGAPLAYWLPDEVLQLFRAIPALQPTTADARQGVSTANDPRFVRQWWEVRYGEIGKGKAWVPFAKGGDFCRFFSDIDLVIRWKSDGEEIRNASGAIRNEHSYFRPGLTWPRRTQGGFNVRSLPAGCIFADKGPSIFVKDDGDTDYLLGILNSSLAEYFCRALMSFGSYEIGVIQKLPIPRAGKPTKQRIAAIARRIHDAKMAWGSGSETATRFGEPWLASVLRRQPEISLSAALQTVLADETAAEASIQASYAELESSVFDLYGVSTSARDTVLSDLGSRPPELAWPQMKEKTADQKRMEHVVRLIAFCVRRILVDDDDGTVPLVPCNNEPALDERVLSELGKIVGPERIHTLEGEISSELRKKVLGYRKSDSIADFLTDAFFEHHVKLYKSRPIFWHLASTSEGGSPSFSVLVHYHRFSTDALRKLRGTYIRSFLDRRARELAQARKDNRADEALEIQRAIEETQDFDKKLEGLEEGRYPIHVPWKSGAEQPKGWAPNIDDGVMVNILPLQTAGLLRIAKVVSTKGEEEE